MTSFLCLTPFRVDGGVQKDGINGNGKAGCNNNGGGAFTGGAFGLGNVHAGYATPPPAPPAVQRSEEPMEVD